MEAIKDCLISREKSNNRRKRCDVHYHISRKFKAVTGIGINRYITYVRISNAEKLLKKGGISVAEAARCCGYNDSNYFSIVFRRIQGVTPFRLLKQNSNTMISG